MLIYNSQSEQILHNDEARIRNGTRFCYAQKSKERYLIKCRTSAAFLFGAVFTWRMRGFITPPKSYSTCPTIDSATPDTRFEGSAPDGYSIPSTPASKSGYAIWWEYTCSGGTFIKSYYGIGISNGGITSITPTIEATAVPTGSTWTMKSGYGISLKTTNALTSIFGFRTPSSSAFTSVQYAYAVFPEYSYSSLYGKYRTLEKSGSYWCFRQNDDYGKVHFLPLWYPDDNYTVKVLSLTLGHLRA